MTFWIRSIGKANIYKIGMVFEGMDNNRQKFPKFNTVKAQYLVIASYALGVSSCCLYLKAPTSHTVLFAGLICSIAGLICIIFSWNEHRKKIWLVGLALNIIMLILYAVYMLQLAGIVARVLADILLLVICVLLLWCASFPLFFLVFSPQRKSLSEQYLFIGRIKDLMKYISSLMALFAGGYFGWLVGSELDGLEKKISNINEALAQGNGSHGERMRAWHSAVSNVQNFVIDQVNVLLSFLLIIFDVWLFILVVDLVRARMSHSLMDSFKVFESVGQHILIDKFKSSNIRVFSYAKHSLSRFYKWYKRKAQIVAEDGLLLFICMLMFLFISMYALDLLKLNLQVEFKNWFLFQTDQIQPSY